jgi:outer membrane protein OmpA-like peptidoglycan-associated protein
MLALCWVAVASGNQEASDKGGMISFAAAQDRSEAAATRVTVDWEDPEPPTAQALAEEVLNAEWNRDKITTLQMRITTLADHTTGIEGFATRLAAKKTSLEDRLTGLGAEITETEVTIRLPGAVLFDFDSPVIRVDAERTLLELAEVLKAYTGRPVRIEGHTDSISSDLYNQKLSEQRAVSVRDWLVAHAVETGRLRTFGHGESRPVADNSTPAGRQLNRRVEIIIEKASGSNP